MGTEEVFDVSQAIGLAEAAKYMRGRGGKKPSVETVRRWCSLTKGCSVGGKVLILHAVRVNGELLTMPGWVEAFEAERIRMGDRQPQAPLCRTPRQREAGMRRARERLTADGIVVEGG